jgi:hypothetical protein
VTDADADAALEVNAELVAIPKLDGRAKLEGTPVAATGKDIRYDVGTGKATIPSLALTLNGQSVGVDGTVDTRAGAGELNVGSDPLDVDKLAAAVAPLAPQLKDMSPRGRATVDAKAKFGPGNALDASGHLVLADVAAKMGPNAVSGVGGTIAFAATPAKRTVGSEQIQLRVADQPVTASFSAEATDEAATLQSLTAQVFGGTTKASGTFTMATRRFTADLGAERLDIAKAFAALDPTRPHPLSGTLTRVSAQLAGTAADTPEATQQSITGHGAVLLENGRYTGVNLLAEVMKALRSIPLISTVVADAIPGDLRRMLDGDVTEITSLRSDFTLGGAAVRLANLVLTNPALAFEGGGRVSFERRIDVAGSVALSTNVTKSIVGKVKEVKFALDPLGRLAIPVSISGTPPKVTVVPDVARLTTGAARALIENQATRLLQDALGGRKGKKGKRDGGLPFKLPKF